MTQIFDMIPCHICRGMIDRHNNGHKMDCGNNYGTQRKVSKG